MAAMRRVSLLLVPLLFLTLFLAGCADSQPSVEDPGPPVGTEEKEEQPSEVENPEPVGELEVHFIDVGQGDAIYIQTPEQNVLIDGGGRGHTVVEYLQARDVVQLDLVIGTHPHADHIGGLINVMQVFPVEEVIDPAVVHTTQTFEEYLTLIDSSNITFTEGRAGLTRDLGGGARLDLLHPTQPSSAHLNNASIVAQLSYGEATFLFTGDIEQQGESELLYRGGHLLESDVLKVAHHGSGTSTSSAFLNAVEPEIAVIMCGEDNPYGHPHPRVLELFNDRGVEVYRTDTHGSIVFVTDGETLDVAWGKDGSTQPDSGSGSVSVPVLTEPDEIEGITEPDQDGFLGSRNSDKYHYPNCHHAGRIYPQNRFWFSSPQDAANRGYVPCAVCRPPT